MWRHHICFEECFLGLLNDCFWKCCSIYQLQFTYIDGSLLLLLSALVVDSSPRPGTLLRKLPSETDMTPIVAMCPNCLWFTPPLMDAISSCFIQHLSAVLSVVKCPRPTAARVFSAVQMLLWSWLKSSLILTICHFPFTFLIYNYKFNYYISHYWWNRH